MRIWVNGDFLDQNEETNIAQTFVVSDIGSLKDKSGGYSNKFKLPLTSRNRELLEYPDDFNSSSRNPYNKINASLYDIGAVVASGYIKYTLVKNSQEITCTFYSDNTDWINEIKGKNIRDIDLSDFAFEWSDTGIKNNIDSDPSTGVCFPLIDYGRLSDNTSLEVNVEDMLPAVFVNTIVSSIYNEVGWKVSGELIDHPLYKRMIIPFSAEEFKLPTDPNPYEISPFEEYLSLPVLVDVDLTVGGVSEFYPEDTGNYIITANIDLEIPSASTTMVVEFSIIVNNVTEYFYSTQIQTSSVPYSNTISISTDNVFVDLGADGVYVRTILRAGTGTVNIQEGGGVVFQQDQTISDGETINTPQDILPNILQTDLLKHLFFSFGIIPQSDTVNKEVSLNFFNNISNRSNNAADWSDKLDLGKDYTNDFTQILNQYATQSDIKYKVDSNDPYLKDYFDSNKKNIGDGMFNIENEFIRNVKTIYTSPFSAMTNQMSFDGLVYIPYINYYQDDTYEETSTLSPKIAIMSENIPVSDITGGSSGYEDLTVGGEVITDMPICWFVKTQINDAYNQYKDSLVFENPEGVGYLDDTLKSVFLLDYERMLNNIKYLKAYFLLNETDISSLDFSKPVYIDKFKSYFYISKIKNYRGSTIPTQCELIRIT